MIIYGVSSPCQASCWMLGMNTIFIRKKLQALCILETHLLSTLRPSLMLLQSFDTAGMGQV